MTTPSNLKVGVAQTESVLGDPVANLQKHLGMIEAARAEGVEVLRFPEMSPTGHNAGPETQRLIDREIDRLVSIVDVPDTLRSL